MSEAHQSPSQLALQRLCKNKLAICSFWVLLVIALSCVFGPMLSPYDYDAQNLELGPTGPSAQHWLGTDMLGRDQLTRILIGGRISFAVALAATLVSLTVGVAYGILSGYVGGKVDSVMMRTIELINALPFTIFVILLMVIFGQNIYLLFVAIGLVEWIVMARIIRGQVLSLRKQLFVEAARCLGQSHIAVMRKHILPNILGIVVIYSTLTIPSVMLLESFISFLGLGVQAPMTSWGDLISTGADAMETQPWLLIYPSLFFSATLLCLNFLGDGLRDALDPKGK